MATADEYAAWIVQNKDKKGSPQFDTVAKAYQLAKASNEQAPEAALPAEISPPEQHNMLSNMGMGVAKGVSDIGTTLLRPYDALKDALGGEQQNVEGLISGQHPQSSHDQRRASLDQFFAENANPESLPFRGGETAADVAGTAGVGGVFAKGAQAIPVLANMAPALASGGMSLGAAKTSSRIANLLLRMGAGGVVGGTSAGLINPDTAMAGAGIGAALPPAVSTAAKIGSAAGKPISEVTKAIINALRTPDEQSTRLIAKAFARDGVDRNMLTQIMRGLGPNAMPADAGGKNVLGLADYAATIPGQAKDQGLTALNNRAMGAGDRVNGALQRALGVPSTATDDIVQGLHQNMRDIAATHGYDDILNNGIVEYGPQLQKLMTGPTMQDAMGSAQRIVKNDIARGKADSSVQDFFQMSEDGGMFAPFGGFHGDMAERPTLRAWDYVKRGLDRIIHEETDPVTGKLSQKGGEAVDFKSQMMPHLERGNDAYTAVRSAYADEKAGESALNLGRKFMRDDFDVTNRRLSEMSPADRKYFQVGVSRAAQDMIETGKRTGMRYADFLEKPGLTKKLQSAFGGDTPEFRLFMTQLGNEARMGQTHAAVGKNSMTAARLAAAQDAGAPIAGPSIPTTKMGLIKSGIDYVSKPNEEVSARLLPQLLSSDPSDLARLLSSLKGLESKMGKKVALPSGISELLRSGAITSQSSQ